MWLHATINHLQPHLDIFESESTQDDCVQSTTRYYVYKRRYEHAIIWVHKSNETNMETKVYHVNPTQELAIETNPTQEPKLKSIMTNN